MSTTLDPLANAITNEFDPTNEGPEPNESEFDTSEFTEIERGDTFVRIALTLLFAIVNSVVNWVLGVAIAFELLWTLVAKLPPSPQIRGLGNRWVAFQYRIGRYMTYNESTVPFPFSEFPAEVEPGDFDPARRDSQDLGLPRDWMRRGRGQEAARDGDGREGPSGEPSCRLGTDESGNIHERDASEQR